MAIAGCTTAIPTGPPGQAQPTGHRAQLQGHPARPKGHAARPKGHAAQPKGHGTRLASTPRPGLVTGTPTNWPAYHANAERSGRVGGLPRAAGDLAVAWTRPLDGAVYGQPLVIGNVVIAATENDSVYGLDWATGRVRWRRHLGTPLPLAAQPCGDIGPLGITSTPVYDQATGLVYALAQVGRTKHLLAGLDPATGAVRYLRQVPSPDGHPYYDQQRGALAAGNGRVYVTFGGHAGDCGPYRGSVVAMPVGMPVSGGGRVVSYMPARVHGGMWAPGGPVIAPDGTVFVSAGNGARSAPYDGSDSVTTLSPSLRRIGLFAPSSWLSDNRNDLDLGSMTPALIGRTWLVIAGKSGTGYLLRASRLGGIGGQVRRAPVCPAFGGAVVDGTMVIVPCSSGGPTAVAWSPTRFGVRWRGPAAADGSPVAGGGAIWVTANSAGTLYELNPATGKIRSQIRLGTQLPHFASPTLSGDLVLIGTLHGVIAIVGA
jgi:outer membrane protein assembly factor BamB